MDNKNKTKSEYSGQPKKSLAIRIIVLAIAAIMFVGTIALSFISAFNTR